ncbi:hypothetical protein [Acinetobacter radioresistens]|uniref:hypothetical protein n=1 Tax=Acinetobacter radioresistens TaxID=40216 RepID=UPI000E7270EA|nr:hypothetical protein [Acinetobacter radioresistens]RJL71052.1 hypothetical protein D5055_08590 [Acinetobacter radioresistens]
MLKIGLIILVIVFFIILLALLYQSQKMLRAVEKQEAQEKVNRPAPKRRLHPKLQAQQKQKK